MRDPTERPHSGSNFLVDIGSADPHSPGGGFAEVILPPFRGAAAAIGHASSATGVPSADAPSVAERPRLVLRRGVTGRLDLYRWWDETQRASAPPTRTVTVQLLADDHVTVVVTWRFHRAHPISLSYSPLRALDASVLMETLELVYERVEMA